jgi:coenzyme F420-0:L-glutamate ligase / coenzyme F420-1:gamma-L-glutamate ligase
MSVGCGSELVVRAVPGVPIVEAGTDVATVVDEAVRRAGIELISGDVLVVASKLVSRAEGRLVDLDTVTVSPRAADLAAAIDKDPRLVELILRESAAVSRAAPGVLIVRHRLGFVSANAGIDASNAGAGVLLLPVDPDGTAARIRDRLGVDIGVVVSDSLGRPFRLGSVGAAVGVAGLPPLCDQRGRLDLFGRPLEHTMTAVADEVAAAADLVAGQSGEGRAIVHVRGLSFAGRASAAGELVRPLDQDLYA